MSAVLVPLNRGAVALISPEDAQRVLGFHWSLSGGERGRNYAARNDNGFTRYMHREILGALPGQYVDHRDGNPLNNQRENIRLCTQSQNLGNVRARRQYKGVSRKRGLWAAFLSPRKTGKKNLGTFATAEEAAIAYDHAARAYFGEFAKTNFPDVRPLPLTIRQRLMVEPQFCRGCGAPIVVSPVGIVRLFCTTRCYDAFRRSK